MRSILALVQIIKVNTELQKAIRRSPEQYNYYILHITVCVTVPSHTVLY